MYLKNILVIVCVLSSVLIHTDGRASGSSNRKGNPGCHHKGNSYEHGEKFLEGCSTCYCSSGSIGCSYTSCNDHSCKYKDTMYESGERFQHENCQQCMCHEAAISCYKAECPDTEPEY